MPVTDQFQNTELRNTGFEAGLNGWLRGTTLPFDFNVGTSASIYHSGQASGYIEGLTSAPYSSVYLDLHQILNAKKYKGQRIGFSAYLKTEGVENQAEMWIGVQDAFGKLLSSEGTKVDQIKGTTDWHQYETAVDVPENSYSIYLALLLDGKGKLWMDVVQLKVVGTLTPTPTR